MIARAAGSLISSRETAPIPSSWGGGAGMASLGAPLVLERISAELTLGASTLLGSEGLASTLGASCLGGSASATCLEVLSKLGLAITTCCGSTIVLSCAIYLSLF